MQHLVILNYNTSSVSFLKVNSDIEINEDYIRDKLNLNPDECIWMASTKGINIQFDNRHDL